MERHTYMKNTCTNRKEDKSVMTTRVQIKTPGQFLTQISWWVYIHIFGFWQMVGVGIICGSGYREKSNEKTNKCNAWACQQSY